jgi:hypothetical protein
MIKSSCLVIAETGLWHPANFSSNIKGAFMITVFRDWDSLAKAYPESASLIESENEQQFPEAKFLEARLEPCDDYDDDGEPEISLNVFFDISDPNDVLWVWLHGTETGLQEDIYIDEYYQIPRKDAVDTYHLGEP